MRDVSVTRIVYTFSYGFPQTEFWKYEKNANWKEEKIILPEDFSVKIIVQDIDTTWSNLIAFFGFR